MTDVALFMRVQDQSEICIGHVATMQDVPRLLEEVAALWRGRYLADAYADHDHVLVQHRDCRPPWCKVCRRTATGTLVPQSVSGRSSDG